MSESSTSNAPSITNVPAWMWERFPPDHWVMFATMYATALFVGRAGVTEGTLTVGGSDLVGFVAAWSFFLMLRVFDEHKDYELDLHNHPERVLQSGRVSLGHLKVLGCLAIATQAGASLWLDSSFGAVSMAWLFVIVWSSLMAKEFFVGEWLEERLVLYALSHMVVMPMALVWMAQMGAGGHRLASTIGPLAALSFLSGAAFEIARKLKGAEEERETIQSYSRIFGPLRGALIVLFLLTAGTALLAHLLHGVLVVGSSWLWYALLATLLAVPAGTLHRYSRVPTAKARKANEAAVGLAMLAGYGLLIAAIIHSKGLQWG